MQEGTEPAPTAAQPAKVACSVLREATQVIGNCDHVQLGEEEILYRYNLIFSDRCLQRISIPVFT